MAEKVYCIRCKHFVGSLSIHEECTAEVIKVSHTYFKRYVRFANPKKKNRKNNCRDFEQRDDDRKDE